MASSNNKFLEARRVTMYTLIVLILLTLLKILAGYLSSSIALVADGFHSFSDVIIVLIAFIVVNMLAKKPSKRFPYGYYKLEDLATLLISVIFVIVAFNLSYEALERILNGSIARTNVGLASAIAFICSIVSYFIADRQEKVAAKFNITSLLLNAREMKYDAASSLLVGLSIILAPILYLPLEEIVAIIISILILRISIIGMKESILDLLDAWDQPEIVSKIREILLSFSNVRKVKLIRVRKAGPLIFGDIVIEVPSGMSIDQIHAMTDSIELKLREEIPSLSDIIIHAEPARKKELIVCIPVNRINDKIEISNHFGRAPLIAFISIDMDKKSFKIKSIVNNPYIKSSKHSGVKLARILGEKGVDVVIVRNIGEASFYSLKAYMIDIFRTQSTEIENAIGDLLSGKLEKLDEPTKEEQ